MRPKKSGARTESSRISQPARPEQRTGEVHSLAADLKKGVDPGLEVLEKRKEGVKEEEQGEVWCRESPRERGCPTAVRKGRGRPLGEEKGREPQMARKRTRGERRIWKFTRREGARENIFETNTSDKDTHGLIIGS